MTAGERCRELALEARRHSEGPGRKLWKSRGWVSRCEAAARDGCLHLYGGIAVEHLRIGGKEILDGFIAAARDDGFIARVDRPEAGEVRMIVRWDEAPPEAAKETP